MKTERRGRSSRARGGGEGRSLPSAETSVTGPGSAGAGGARLRAADAQLVVLHRRVLVLVDRHVCDLADEEVVPRTGSNQVEGADVRQRRVVCVEALGVRAVRDAGDVVGVAGD